MIKSAAGFIAGPLLFLGLIAIFLSAYYETIPDLLLRFFAAIWFLIWYKRVLDRFFKLYDHRAGSIDPAEAAAGLRHIFDRKGKEREEHDQAVQLPGEYYHLARKINICRQSRKHLLGWLSDEGAPERLKDRVMAGKDRDERVNPEELKEILRELYRYKSSPSEEAYHESEKH